METEETARADAAEPVHLVEQETFDTLSGSTVLMIDDEPITLEVIQTFLSEVGYRNIQTLSQPAEALTRIRRDSPDVVLLDLLMPGVSGFDILKAMRADEDLRYVPVIILTAASDAETKLEALDLGATDFLSKPVDPSELTLRLRNTLAFKAYRDRLAYSDSLTGLPNRRSFIDQLRETLRHHGPDSKRLGVLHVDLDRFKHINDTLGYAAGDAILKAVARRLEESLKQCEKMRGGEFEGQFILSRLSGDEFTILIPDLPSSELAGVVAGRIAQALAAPFSVTDHELFLSASVGIAISPNDGEDVATLLKHSDIAMHAAKQQGRNTFEYYSAELNARAMERLTLENGLRRAIERDELVLYYQPQVELGDARIVGFEALMRWRHPGLGLLMPGRFIPIAEETGLIGDLGDWALFEACRQLAAWKRAGYAGLTVSVNVAPPQIKRPHFLDSLKQALAESGIEPRQLIVEVTETMLMSQAEQGLALLGQIKQLGVGLSIDDFGTGYSSLSYIKRLPLDEIKIDRSFVDDMTSSRESKAIVATVLTLAAGLGLEVIAEGVETEAQRAALEQLHCRRYQGYLYSRPEPAEHIDQLLATERARAAR